jgi:hypothetical protein
MSEDWLPWLAASFFALQIWVTVGILVATLRRQRLRRHTAPIRSLCTARAYAGPEPFRMMAACIPPPSVGVRSP